MRKNLFLLSATVLAMGVLVGCPPAQNGNPEIAITSVPPYGAFGNLDGTVKNVNNFQYDVVVYIDVNGTPWLKPYASTHTPISIFGTYSCNVTTGGHDELATAFHVFVVRKTYQPQLNVMPQASDYIATASLDRTPPKPPIDLSFLTPIINRTAKVINYAPRHFNPNTSTFPTDSEISADLTQLRTEGFDGITIFDVSGTLGDIPVQAKADFEKAIAAQHVKAVSLAKSAGFTYVFIGIWDIKNQTSINTAVSLKNHATAYLVGSEGLLRGDYQAADVIAAMKIVRDATNIATSTADIPSSLTANPQVIDASDFVSVNIYGWWEGSRTPQAAVNVLVNEYASIDAFVASRDPNKITIVRETGYPSGGHPAASIQSQIDYFNLADQTTVPYFVFEAYDQPWKVEYSDGYNIGPYLGINDMDGNLKQPPVVEAGIHFTYVPPIGSFDLLTGTVGGYDVHAYKVVVYILVNGTYWVKPYLNTPLTPINADGTWSCDITTGGIDDQATEIRAYVVANDYVADLHLLPADGTFVASVVATR